MKYILTSLVLLLSACGPVYHTSYTYTPPGDFRGNQCTNNCQLSRQQCEQIEMQTYQACENRASLEYNLCQSRKVYVYKPKKKKTECVSNCYCSRPSCTEPNGKLCTTRYNSCYLNCGGTVVSTTQCVRNCEEAAPPSTQVMRGALTE